MTPEGLQLAFQQSKFVRRFFYYESIASTNDKAKELAIQGVEEGTLVLAAAQTSGRGRNDRTWFSAPGLGIYASLIFRPQNLPAPNAFGILASVALGAIEAVDAVDAAEPKANVGIKWPNDLVVGEKKLAGILSEVGTKGGNVDWCVVGIGLNVNHEASDFPNGLQSRATSLNVLCDRTFELQPILVEMVERTGVWYRTFLDQGMSTLLAAWRERSIILGREVRLETAGETYVGEAVAIEDNGGLRIRMEGGVEEVLHAGDIQLAQVR